MFTACRPGYERYAHCRCCGEGMLDTKARPELDRCERHADRNPCAIEGCARTTAADGQLDGGEWWLCGTHWRKAVPPRSMLRRQYHRYFRLAKRHGWDAQVGGSQRTIRTRFWTFWAMLVRLARERCQDGHLDTAEIDRFLETM